MWVVVRWWEKLGRGMRTLILGMGVSGQAAYALLRGEGDEVVGIDDFPRVEAFDRVVVSPGISREHRGGEEAVKRGVKVVGEVELAMERMRGVCIAVTGTNGKTTVVRMVEHVLRYVGRRAT